MPNLQETLDGLLDGWDRSARAANPDALDRLLAEPPRTTAVTSLRDHEHVRTFRDELAAGFVQTKTVVRLLQLISDLTGIIKA